jgi:hypothetical protein
MAFVLNRLSYAVMSHVVVIALTAEGSPAALNTAVVADRNSTVSTFRYGRLSTSEWSSGSVPLSGRFTEFASVIQGRCDRESRSLARWAIAYRCYSSFPCTSSTVALFLCQGQMRLTMAYLLEHPRGEQEQIFGSVILEDYFGQHSYSQLKPSMLGRRYPSILWT